jgi:hypothetical protein
MRFFSNDSKDSSDDRPDVDVQDRAEQVNPDQAHDDYPEHVQSDPVSVPQQRAGSPWSSAPDTADSSDAELADDERRDGTTDAPPFHEPSPQPTAFGASTVGGAVAASATANPQNDTWTATDRDAAADSGVGDDRSVAPGDGVVRDDDGTDTPGAHRIEPVEVPLDDREAEHRVEDPTPPDTSLTGTTGAGAALKDDGGFDDPKAVDPATSEPLDSSAASGGVLKDDGGFDDPKAVDPATDEPLDPAAAAAGTAAVAAVPVGAAAASSTTSSSADSSASAAAPSASADADGDRKPGSVSAPDLGSLFDKDDAKGFQERWRDVQLRFVDSPKDATTEAAALVDEAVDRLTAGLKAQKGKLTQGSEDTEQLRVELRGYRDMLNRILDL